MARKLSFILIFLLPINLLSTAQPSIHQNLIFGGDHLVYQGKKVTLGSKAFYIDGQLSDQEAAKYSFVYNSVNEAAKHLTDGTEDSPMVLYIAPWVYWIDDPDDPAIRVPKSGGTPFGLEIKCEWLKFFGLSDDAFNVVLACNRGQTIGSQGNFTMFKISGEGTSSENITFGNYCNIDLVYPLKPELSRKKRASAIVQAQLVFCDGDKLVARNTRFVSRLNLCPFSRGKRVLFDRCHFESTDDALNGTAVYLNCTFDFYSGKPFWGAFGTGAVFFNCDIKSFTRGEQYFTKIGGQVAALDTRFESETVTYLGWRDIPAQESPNYQYNIQMNGKPVFIGLHHPQSTIDMTGKAILDAYRLVYKDKVIYNTYNLLRGNDDWDPMGIKSIVLAAEKESGKAFTQLPVQLLVAPSKVSIETGKDDIRLNAKINRFGNYGANGETIKWAVAPEYESYVELKVSEDGVTCDVKPTNTTDEAKQVIVTASTPSGLKAASVLNVTPSLLDTPKFSSLPQISQSKNGKLTVDYNLDMRFDDQSLVSWYRCTDAKGANPIEVAVSRLNKPMLEYELSSGDIGYYLMALVAPKHIRCNAGEAVAVLTNKPISAQDIKTENSVLYTDFRNFSTKNQPEVIPGFWTSSSLGLTNNEKDAWFYGEGSDGAVNALGLLPAQNARLFYTPVVKESGDMKLTMAVAPFKTAGQGFSLAHRYMDILIKFDMNAMTGYGLRFIRTTKYHDAVDCVFVKYEGGHIVEISEPVSTTCYRTPCYITIDVKGNKITAHAESSAEYYIVPNRPEVVQKINMDANIIPNKYGGFGIQYSDGSAAMIKEMKVEWK